MCSCYCTRETGYVNFFLILKCNFHAKHFFSFRNIDFGDLLAPEVRATHKFTTYDLMANIVHDGEPGPGKGTYRAHILHKVTLYSETSLRDHSEIKTSSLVRHPARRLVFLFQSMCQLYNDIIPILGPSG